ncbi:MAG: hypothetical protein ABI036_04110 [Fibrobacteria bacterium]
MKPILLDIGLKGITFKLNAKDREMNFANTVSGLALALSMAGGIGGGDFSIATPSPKTGPIKPINPCPKISAIQPIKVDSGATPLRPRPQPPILRRHPASTKFLNPIG